MKKSQKKSLTGSLLALLIIFLAIAASVWLIKSRPPMPEDEIISRNGLHWHAELSIYVKGEKRGIPSNIGIGAVHQPVHTHENDGVIHMEFPGQVLRKDIALGEFFKNWNKDMRSFGANMKMIVNGKENTKFENYIMQDKDKIELQFE